MYCSADTLHNLCFLLMQNPMEDRILNAPPRQIVELLQDDGVNVNIDHPDNPIERDHPLLANARILGAEKRLDIMGRLPR